MRRDDIRTGLSGGEIGRHLDSGAADVDTDGPHVERMDRKVKTTNDISPALYTLLRWSLGTNVFVMIGISIVLGAPPPSTHGIVIVDVVDRR